MLQMLVTIIVVAISLYVTLFVHEWAHYLVAKRFGIRPKSINLGLGPILLSSRSEKHIPIHIRLMPIGGYMDLDEMAYFRDTGLSPRTRCLIALAGPLGNLVFCMYLAVILSLVGIPLYSSSLVVGFVRPDVELDVKPGDEVVTVDGKSVKTWNQVRAASFATSKTNLTVVFQRGDVRFTNSVPIAVYGLITPKIPMSPVQKLYQRLSPMQTREIVKIDGSQYFNGDTLSWAYQSNRTVAVTFRENGRLTTEQMHLSEKTLYDIWEKEPSVIYANPLLILGGTTWQICKSLWQIIGPKTNLCAQNLSGPLTTMLFLHRFFETDVRLGLFLLLALNLNLILFNLVPIYPMDGVHVLLLIFRRPKHIEFIKKCQWFAAWGILGALLYMLLLDVLKFAVL